MLVLSRQKLVFINSYLQRFWVISVIHSCSWIFYLWKVNYRVASRVSHDLFPFWNLRSNPPPRWSRKCFSKRGPFKKISRFFCVFCTFHETHCEKNLRPDLFKKITFYCNFIRHFFQSFLKRRIRRRKTYFSGASRPKNKIESPPSPRKLKIEPLPSPADGRRTPPRKEVCDTLVISRISFAFITLFFWGKWDKLSLLLLPSFASEKYLPWLSQWALKSKL